MAEEVRELKARVTVEKGGDAGAFASTARDIGAVEDAAASAERGLGSLDESLAEAAASGKDIGAGATAGLDALQAEIGDTETQLDGLLAKEREVADAGQEVADAADGQSEALEGVAKGAGGAEVSMGKLASSMPQMLRAFEQGYRLGSQLRDVLNEMTGGAFDRVTQQMTGMTSAADALAGNIGNTADTSERLANQMEILRKRGIDPTGMSAEEVEGKVEELAKQLHAAAEAAAAATPSVQGTGDAVAATATATGEAGTKSKELAEASKEVATAGDAQAASAKEQANATNEMASALQTGAAAAGAILMQLQAIAELDFASPIVAQFDAIITKAGEAKAAMAAVVAAGNGEGAAAPAGGG